MAHLDSPTERELRGRIMRELAGAGFVLDGRDLRLPGDGDDDPKQIARGLHAVHRANVLEKNSAFISAWEDKLLDNFAAGTDVAPDAITPVVVPVQTEAEAALFRFASLHWSVPVSQGYGRRSRFLVRDDANGKLIGIFALGDPVFNLGVRDRLIGWDVSQRQHRLYSTFDAYVLGAIEPYRQLIAGKLMALCAVSNETAAYLRQKYEGKVTVIQETVKSAEPVLITTTSALGRSSIYNRLKYRDRWVFKSIGFTEGFGHFHFSDGLFDDLVAYLTEQHGEIRGHQYGDGPNWRIRTIRKGLEDLGLNGDLLKHGIRREVFVAPRGVGWRAYLRGETNVVRWFDYPIDELSSFWRARWAIPRAARDQTYRAHTPELMRLTPQLELVAG